MYDSVLPRPWDSPGKNTGVGCHFLLQGIFLTQGLNLGLSQCRMMLYHLSHQGSPEDIKKRWQEYTEELYKDLHDPDNHDGVITDLEPDILECEVKWALESPLRTKLVEVMEFQLSYSKS